MATGGSDSGYGSSPEPPGVHSDAWRTAGGSPGLVSGLLFFEGGAALVAGIALLVVPDRTLALFGAIFGIYLICAGLLRMLVSARASDRHALLWRIVGGLTCAAGIVVLFTPGDSVRAVVVIFAAYLLVSAAAAVAAPIDRGTGLVSGALALIAAAALLATPDASRTTIATIVGAYLIAAGVVSLIAGRRAAASPPGGPAAA